MKKLLIVLILFSSCSTEKKASKSTDKAYIKYPLMMAKKTRDWFPCVKIKADTTIKLDTVYDLIEVQCPDTISYRVDSFETVTAVKVPVYIKVAVPSPIQTITVTNTVEDSSNIFILKEEVTKCDNEKNKLEKKVHKRGKVIMWLIFLVIGFCIPYIIKIIKLLK